MKNKTEKIAKEKVVKEKKTKPQKQVTLEKEIYNKTILVNVFSGTGIFIIIVMSFLIRKDQWIACLIYLGVLVAIAEGIIARICNRIITRKLSDDFEKWRRGELDIEGRTKLFEDVMAFPTKKKGTEAFCIYTFTAFGFVFGCHFTPQIGISLTDLVASLAAASYGAFFATHATFLATESVCNKHAIEIIKSGVNNERLMQKKSYGMSVAMRGLLYVIVPILFSIIIVIYITYQAYRIQNEQYVSFLAHASRIIFFTVFWISIVFVSLTVTARESVHYNNIMCDAINKILTLKTISKSAEDMADTNLNGRSQYNIFLLNQLIMQYRGILKAANKTNMGVRGITENLSVVASELASTSLEQSADVKEILSTMEEANKLSNVIREHTMGVTDGADKTKDDVNAADTALTENRNQIESIYNSNKQIIESIRNLGNQVENIDDVVTMIRDIADQTRIIAFNAELEAVGAGDEGRNFHIVAAETRRLASSTMESISNIQEYIEAIKEASKSLITSSESQTLFIQEEMQTIRELVRHFDLIKASAENTSTKSVEIESIVDQQSSSFNQIVITLRQIGAGVESFTDSAHSISESAEAIREVALQLEHLQD